jgi:hypothetical protein
MACALPAEQAVPLSRWSAAELAREAVGRGIVEGSATSPYGAGCRPTRSRPWQHRSWIFPRDPHFADRAGPILDLYQGAGREVAPYRRVRGLRRRETLDPGAHKDRPTRPARPGAASGSNTSTSGGVRSATWPPGMPAGPRSSTAALPRRASSPFDTLVEQFISEHPYKKAQRVFLIDNGSAHRGKRSIARLQGDWPNLIVVHNPIHASWLNQAEIYFSVVQRKVVTPKRLRRPRPRSTATGLRPPLRAASRALPVDVHPPGSQRAAGKSDATRITSLAA